MSQTRRSRRKQLRIRARSLPAKPPADPPGHRALAAYLRDSAKSQAWLAKRIGIGQQSISMWLRGENTPGAAHQKAIQLATGINVDDWLTAEERRHLATVERRVWRTG